MNARTNDDRTTLCSVTEMACKLGLSRARLYQLVSKGVFPPPVRSGTQRPFYPPDLQQKCLQIRKAGVGFNGRPVLFNRCRKRATARRGDRGQYDEFVAALKYMGLNVNANAVGRAVRLLYTMGLEKGRDRNEVLRDLVRHFYQDRQNGVECV